MPLAVRAAFVVCPGGMSAAKGYGKTNAAARVYGAGQANEADLQGCHEARGGDRSVTGKDFAQPARRHESRFVLESRPPVARRRDTKPLDRDCASTESSFAHDREMDTTHA